MHRLLSLGRRCDRGLARTLSTSTRISTNFSTNRPRHARRQPMYSPSPTPTHMRYFTTTRISDRDLDVAFYNPSFSSAVSRSILTTEGWGEYRRLQEAGAIRLGGTFSNIFRTLWIFYQLRHPLLKRYEFEPVAFLAGAREAFTQVGWTHTLTPSLTHPLNPPLTPLPTNL
jgi:hypothetical protein